MPGPLTQLFCLLQSEEIYFFGRSAKNWPIGQGPRERSKALSAVVWRTRADVFPGPGRSHAGAGPDFGVNMMEQVEQLLKEIPPITRTYMIAAFATTTACSLELVSPYRLYYSSTLIFQKLELWRLATNFCFFGQNFTLDFLFHMFFLVRYSRALEENSFRGRTADFFYFLLFGATLMSLLAPLFSLQFLGSSLTFMMVYLWGRRNPAAQMNFLGIWPFTGPYLPWLLFSFSLVLGGNFKVDFLGIIVGHLYYFLEDVYPRLIHSRYRLLETPALIERMFASDDRGDFLLEDEDEDENAADGEDGLDADAPGGFRVE